MSANDVMSNFKAPLPNRVKFKVQPKGEGLLPFRAAPNLTQYRAFGREEEQSKEPDVYWPPGNTAHDRTRELETEISQLRAKVAELQQQLDSQQRSGASLPPEKVEEPSPTSTHKPAPKLKSTPVYVRVIDLN